MPTTSKPRDLAKARRGQLLALGLLRLFAALQHNADTLVPLRKGMPDALVLAEPGAIEVLSKWSQEGFTCSVRRAPGGLSYLTIEGGGLALPYHAAVGDVSEARKAADHALPLLRKGLTPREGVFRRSGALRQWPRTGYAVHR